MRNRSKLEEQLLKAEQNKIERENRLYNVWSTALMIAIFGSMLYYAISGVIHKYVEIKKAASTVERIEK